MHLAQHAIDEYSFVLIAFIVRRSRLYAAYKLSPRTNDGIGHDLDWFASCKDYFDCEALYAVPATG